jgi:putative transposase
MPRSAVPGYAYHVFNRGNDKRQLFTQPGDYKEFLSLLRNAPLLKEVQLLAYCVMPNHWHLAVMPSELEALSAYLQWVTGTHGLRWRKRYGHGVPGHVYQARFKSVPILNDRHLFTVLRYVEANPVRAGFVTKARDWPWSSRTLPRDPAAPDRAPWPWPVPANWDQMLDRPQPDHELVAIRSALRKGTPIAEESTDSRSVESESPPESQQILFSWGDPKPRRTGVG